MIPNAPKNPTEGTDSRRRVLFQQGGWKVVQTVEDPEYAEIRHDCDVDQIDHTNNHVGLSTCLGCEEEIPEEIETVAALYSKGTAKASIAGNFDEVMKQIFWKMYKQSSLGKSNAKLVDITVPE
jgi:hypothetical protein